MSSRKVHTYSTTLEAKASSGDSVSLTSTTDDVEEHRRSTDYMARLAGGFFKSGGSKLLAEPASSRKPILLEEPSKICTYQNCIAVNPEHKLGSDICVASPFRRYVCFKKYGNINRSGKKQTCDRRDCQGAKGQTIAPGHTYGGVGCIGLSIDRSIVLDTMTMAEEQGIELDIDVDDAPAKKLAERKRTAVKIKAEAAEIKRRADAPAKKLAERKRTDVKIKAEVAEAKKLAERKRAGAKAAEESDDDELSPQDLAALAVLRARVDRAAAKASRADRSDAKERETEDEAPEAESEDEAPEAEPEDEAAEPASASKAAAALRAAAPRA